LEPKKYPFFVLIERCKYIVDIVRCYFVKGKTCNAFVIYLGFFWVNLIKYDSNVLVRRNENIILSIMLMMYNTLKK